MNVFDELLKCKNDFGYFVSNYIKIVDHTKGLTPLEMYGYQKRIIDAYENEKYILIKKFRKSGITTISVIWFLWKAMFSENQNMLVTAKTEKEAIHIGKIIEIVLQYMPEWLVPRLIKNSQKEKHFAMTNSKMWFCNIESGRGKSLTHVLIDDAAFIPQMEEKWKILYPCIANTSGKVYVPSVVNGFGNWFQKTWYDAVAGKNMFSCLEVNYHEHPIY